MVFRTNLTMFLMASILFECVAMGDEQETRPAPEPPGAPMPKGFPEPTKPDTIEIKKYPSYRSARATEDAVSQRSGNMLFFALFRHIQDRGVEMTSPVINTYLNPELAVDPKATGEMSMEFLYERLDQGEAGQGVGKVQVVDNPPVTVVALGVQGRMSSEIMIDGVKELRAWLNDHKDEWVEAGAPRQLGYHGPMTPMDRRLWEVQLPVRPVSEEGSADPAGPAVAAPEPPESDG